MRAHFRSRSLNGDENHDVTDQNDHKAEEVEAEEDKDGVLPAAGSGRRERETETHAGLAVELAGVLRDQDRDETENEGQEPRTSDQDLWASRGHVNILVKREHDAQDPVYTD